MYCLFIRKLKANLICLSPVTLNHSVPSLLITGDPSSPVHGFRKRSLYAALDGIKYIPSFISEGSPSYRVPGDAYRNISKSPDPTSPIAVSLAVLTSISTSST